jgi:hypothetical protein
MGRLRQTTSRNCLNRSLKRWPICWWRPENFAETASSNGPTSFSEIDIIPVTILSNRGTSPGVNDRRRTRAGSGASFHVGAFDIDRDCLCHHADASLVIGLCQPPSESIIASASFGPQLRRL